MPTQNHSSLRKTVPIYVNLPKSRKIAVLDRETRAIIETWPIGMALANYPMALDQADHRFVRHDSGSRRGCLYPS